MISLLAIKIFLENLIILNVGNKPAIPEIELPITPEISQPPLDNGSTEEVDKW